MHFRLHLPKGGYSVISRDLFSRYVKDALSNYYDAVQLQTHPLAELLLADHPVSGTSGQRLRELLREALEGLKPDPAIPYGRPEWLGYRLLWSRYVDSREQAEVCRELGLSRASYYRHHRDAFEAVVSLLWQRFGGRAASPRASVEGAKEGPSPAVDEAMRLAQVTQRTPVSLTDLLEGVQRTISPWMAQRGITLHVDAPSDLPAIAGDPALLRQLLLNALATAIECVSRDALHLTLVLANGTAVCRISGVDVNRLSPGVVVREGELEMSRGLLAVYGGRLSVERKGESGAIVLTLPSCAMRTVMVIDDDADTIALYQRYLSREGYQLWTAQSSEEAEAWLQRGTPDVILLDVLMPREDGWDILQQLRTSPATVSTPVIICSVLSQPQLALSLGASAVLQKPLSREALVMAIRQALPQPDSAATAHPKGS